MLDRLARTPGAFALVATLSIACGDDGSSPQAGSTGDTDDDNTTSASDPTVDPTTVPTTDPTTTDAESSSGTPADSSTGADSSSTDGPADSSGTTGEETQAVTIAFAATVAGEPFACGQTYEGVGMPGVTVEPADLRFFVQDVRLIRADDDTEVPLVFDVEEPWQAETVALLDFEDATGACGEGTPETRSEITGTIPAGDYDGLVFTIGVPVDLNHADPLTLPQPLDAGTMTWGWLYGYKFLKVELLQVVDEGQPGTGIFHLGSNTCSGVPGVEEVECAQPNRAEFRFDAFDVGSNTAVLDVATLFEMTDLTVMNMCHSAGDSCPPMFERVGVDLETGLPTDTQLVFGVE